jgi:peptidoglycan/LPS O-acetylase OafA/YrhL
MFALDYGVSSDSSRVGYCCPKGEVGVFGDQGTFRRTAFERSSRVQEPVANVRGTSVALDQWRGLALVLVLISHGFYFSECVHGIGRVGVNLFFFISGVLVFRSLAKPRGSPWQTAAGFLKRRMKRLYPALFAYAVLMILVTFAFQNVGDPALHLVPRNYFRNLPFAVTYLTNYWPVDSIRSLGHLWSLSCEMQFYLLAPVIFFLGGKTPTRRFVVWGIILLALITVGFFGPMLDAHGKYKYHFEMAVWPMMLGFCCEYRKDWCRRVPLSWARIAAGICFALFLVSFALMLAGYEMKKLVIACGAFVLVPCFFAYIYGCDLKGWPGRCLAWLGQRTYSIYLWQQPFTICNYLPALWHPIGAVVSTIVGEISFQFFERPFLTAARKKLTRQAHWPNGPQIPILQEQVPQWPRGLEMALTAEKAA